MRLKSEISRFKNALNRIGITEKERRHSLVGKARLWRMKRDFQINYLKARGLQPNHNLLDLGCGTLRGGIPIIEYLNPGNYIGIELNINALLEGLKELKDERLERNRPTLIYARDLGQINLNSRMDYVWAFSVLIHMEDQILDRTMLFIEGNLADEGIFFANVNIDERIDGNWHNFPVVYRRLDFYQEVCAQYGLSVIDKGQLGSLGHRSGIKQQDNQHMLQIERISK